MLEYLRRAIPWRLMLILPRELAERNVVGGFGVVATEANMITIIRMKMLLYELKVRSYYGRVSLTSS